MPCPVCDGDEVTIATIDLAPFTSGVGDDVRARYFDSMREFFAQPTVSIRMERRVTGPRCRGRTCSAGSTARIRIATNCRP